MSLTADHRYKIQMMDMQNRRRSSRLQHIDVVAAFQYRAWKAMLSGDSHARYEYAYACKWHDAGRRWARNKYRARHKKFMRAKAPPSVDEWDCMRANAKEAYARDLRETVYRTQRAATRAMHRRCRGNSSKRPAHQDARRCLFAATRLRGGGDDEESHAYLKSFSGARGPQFDEWINDWNEHASAKFVGKDDSFSLLDVTSQLD